jgi:alkanesulfonate monooxygenase SsuD/methylene tetrahydromethanopterin reductase-like flavin-dependent oxidoreductase (luciferase family)
VDFGISLLPDAGPERKSATTYYRDVLALSRIADEAGLRYVKMTEHYLHPYGGYCPAPLTFLAAVAAQTTRIRLLTGGVIPNYHHPIQLASQVTMVDAISDGRLDVGFARGYLPYEYRAFGIPLDSSQDRFAASVAAMIRLWTQEDVAEDTPYFSFSHATILPRPTQSPYPPLWAAAVRTPRSFEWIGRMGLGLLLTPTLTVMSALREQTQMYRDAFAPSDTGHSDTGPSDTGPSDTGPSDTGPSDSGPSDSGPSDSGPSDTGHSDSGRSDTGHSDSGRSDTGLRPRVALSVPLYVARTDAEAFRDGDALMAEYLRVWLEAADSWNTAWSKDYAAYTGMSTFLREMSPTAWREAGSAVAGSVERVIDRIHELRELAEPDTLLWQVDFGGAGREQAERNLRLFCDRVLPKVADL